MTTEQAPAVAVDDDALVEELRELKKGWSTGKSFSTERRNMDCSECGKTYEVEAYHETTWISEPPQ